MCLGILVPIQINYWLLKPTVFLHQLDIESFQQLSCWICIKTHKGLSCIQIEITQIATIFPSVLHEQCPMGISSHGIVLTWQEYSGSSMIGRVDKEQLSTAGAVCVVVICLTCKCHSTNLISWAYKKETASMVYDCAKYLVWQEVILERKNH